MLVVEEAFDWAWSPAERTRTTHVVLHHAATESASVQDVHSWHLAQGWAGIAYHFYVRKNGVVFRGRPENLRGGHTTDMNSVSLGVCFEGDFQSDIMPQAQIAAGHALLCDIRSRYPGIAVTQHKDHQNTDCPGKNFPLDLIAGGLMNHSKSNKSHPLLTSGT